MWNGTYTPNGCNLIAFLNWSVDTCYAHSRLGPKFSSETPLLSTSASFPAEVSSRHKFLQPHRKTTAFLEIFLTFTEASTFVVAKAELTREHHEDHVACASQ